MASYKIHLLAKLQSRKFQFNNSPVDLYLISEKSIWKNQVGQTGFLFYFELDFYCFCSLQNSILSLFFADYNSSLSNLIFPTWFFKIPVQINRRNVSNTWYKPLAAAVPVHDDISTDSQWVSKSLLLLYYTYFSMTTLLIQTVPPH